MKLFKYISILSGLAGTLTFFTQPAIAAPPANDNFANAQLLGGLEGNVTGNLREATVETDEPILLRYGLRRTIWYKWTAPATGDAEFKIGNSDTTTIIEAYTGDSLSSLKRIGTNANGYDQLATQLFFQAIAGTTYYIALAPINSQEGDLNAQLLWKFNTGGNNDDISGAQVIRGEMGTVLDDNTNATRLDPKLEPFPGGVVSGKSVWFQLTANFTGRIRFNTKGSNFDTVLGAYDTRYGRSVELDSNDNSGSDLTSSISFDVESGLTYYIVVAGAGDASGQVILNWHRSVVLGGKVTNSLGAGVSGVNLNISGPESVSVVTDSFGYLTPDILPGEYRVTPSKANFTFTPTSRVIHVEANYFNGNFVATTKTPPHIAVSNATAIEGNSGTTAAFFTLTLSAASTLPVTVTYSTSNDTAVAPYDYNAVTNKVTFPPGETTQSVGVIVKGDLIDEIDERFNLNLSNPVNATISDNLGVGTIKDDDASPALSVANAAISEGNSGTKILNFTVKLSTASSRTVTVSAKTVPGASTETTEPATAGVDYLALPATTLTFAPGELTKTIGVTINDDVVDEANETFNLVLSSPSNATIGTATATGTITDDDVTPTFSVSDASLTEGNSGTVNAAFTVNLSAASGRAVKVNAATADNTTLAGADYIALAGSTLTFLTGQTSKVVTVAVKGDLIDELNETFQLKLTNPVNATIADSTGIGTIIDDDNAPSISATASSVTEEDGGQINLPFTLKLSAPSSKVITIKVQTSPANSDSATAGTDYVAVPLTAVTFAAGETTKIINVPVYGDLLDEVNEKVGLSLSVPGNATLTTGKVEGIILDDDAPPAFYFWGAIVEEGDNDIRQAYFLATLTQPSGKTVTVSFKTGPSPTTPATEGIDYVAIPPTTITFAPGQTSQKIYFSIIGDTLYEGRERFRGLFSNAVNASLPDTFADAQIIEYDEQPAVLFDAVSVVEGNSGTKTVTLTANLSKPAGVTIQSNYATADDIATAGSDYVARQGTLTFAPGQTKTTTSFTINGDTDNEENESFKVLFPDFPGSPTATITILNDDTPIRPGDGSGGVS